MPNRSHIFLEWIKRRLPSLSRTARVALYLGGAEFVLFLLQSVLRQAGFTNGAAALEGWAGFLGMVIGGLLAFLLLRWFRGYVLWRLRNRLIITYLFIGGVPVFLVALMALICGYMLLGQFASYVTLSEIQAQSQRLEAANAAAVRRITRRAGANVQGNGFTTNLLPSADSGFPGRAVMICEETTCPAWLKPENLKPDGFSGVGVERGAVLLRAARRAEIDGKAVTVVSSVQVDRTFLEQIATGLGKLTLYPTEHEESGGGRRQSIKRNGDDAQLSAGEIPAPRSKWDMGTPLSRFAIGDRLGNGRNGKAASRNCGGNADFGPLLTPVGLVRQMGRCIPHGPDRPGGGLCSHGGHRPVHWRAPDPHDYPFGGESL